MSDEPALAPAPEPERFVRWGLLFYGAMAAVAVGWRIGLQGEPILYASAEAAERGIDPWVDGGLGAAAAAVMLALSHVMTRFTAWGERLARALGSLSVGNALLLASASGLAEEMLFRGALQPVVGWIAASVLFGALHFVPRREFLPWTVFAIVAGLLFGALYEWTGNLLAPAIAHVLVNGVNLPRLIREYGPAAAGGSDA